MSSGDEVKTINMSKQSTKQINPLKILIDNESEVRATNFHGTSKNGRTYISPQVIFVRATAKKISGDQFSVSSTTNNHKCFAQNQE